MEFVRSNNEIQFIPSNLLSGKSDNESERNIESYRQYFDSQVIGFRPNDKLNSSTMTRPNSFRVMHIESDHVQDFEIPFHLVQDDSHSDSKMNSIDSNDLEEHTSLCESVQDYSEYNYENVTVQPQTKLLWSGSHWQIEKLLMDIAFAEDICVSSEEFDQRTIRTILLNNCQDGSIREYKCCKSNKITDIQYNYPDQLIDEHSTVAFSFKKVSELYYISMIVADFSVTLDVPINPDKFCFDYLKRVLSIGGTFYIDR